MKIVSESKFKENIICEHCGKEQEITAEDLRYDYSMIMGQVVDEGYYFFCRVCRRQNKLKKSNPIIKKLKK